MKRLRLLLQDVQRSVEVVHEEATTARFVAQEVDARQLRSRVVAGVVRRDRHLDVIRELERPPRRWICRDRWCGRDTRLRRQRANVIDDVPGLGIRNATVPSRHHRRRNALLDHGVNFAVSRTVVPLVIGQVGRLFATLLRDDRNDDPGFDRALGHVAVTGRTVRVIGLLSGGQRLRRRRDGVLQRGGCRVGRLLTEPSAASGKDNGER